jgi:hypothetical protein
MKTLIILFLLGGIISPALAQVVSNVNWELEGNERIVITYDLARQDNFIYFDVSVKVKIENETITPKALSGDVGSFVKVGTQKKIVWNMFEDISELNGELSVEVLAFNPVPSSSTEAKADKGKKKDATTPSMPRLPMAKDIPFWAGMGGVGVTGIGLLTGGMKSANEGQDLYKIYKENTSESASVYTEMGSSREDVYSEANKKYKNGSLLKLAGAAVLVGAGAVIVNRIIQAKKLERRNMAFSPYINIDPKNTSGKVSAQTGFTLRYRLR